MGTTSEHLRIEGRNESDRVVLGLHGELDLLGAPLLQKGIDNTARLQWNGVGSSEPRYRPESDPANRSRNRRVEIIHVRGT